MKYGIGDIVECLYGLCEIIGARDHETFGELYEVKVLVPSETALMELKGKQVGYIHVSSIKSLVKKISE